MRGGMKVNIIHKDDVNDIRQIKVDILIFYDACDSQLFTF